MVNMAFELLKFDKRIHRLTMLSYYHMTAVRKYAAALQASGTNVYLQWLTNFLLIFLWQ